MTRVFGFIFVTAALLVSVTACDDLPTAPSAMPNAFRNTLCFSPPPPPGSGLPPLRCDPSRDDHRGPRW